MLLGAPTSNSKATTISNRPKPKLATRYAIYIKEKNIITAK